MAVIKSPVLLSILVALCSYNSDSLKPLPYTKGKSNASPWHKFGECICSGHEKRLWASAKLDSYNNGLERLVVFLYRDPATRIIKVYIPRGGGQEKIPDLDYKLGDYVINSAEINTQDLFARLNKETVWFQPKYSDIEDYKHSWEANSKFKPEYGYSNIEDSKHSWETNGKFKPEYGYSNIEESKHSWETNDKFKPEYGYSNIKDSKRLWDTNDKFKPERQNFKHESDESHIDSSEKDEAIKHNNDDVGVDLKTKNRPLVDIETTLDFDAWFDNQMKSNNMKPVASKRIDVVTFKQLIKKTLILNEIYVTKDRKLKDKDGNLILMSKLKLRPILVGPSVAYDGVLLDASRNQLKMLSSIPYVEAMIVTLKRPPKILGVIPLGKIIFPYRDCIDTPIRGNKKHKGFLDMNSHTQTVTKLIPSHKVSKMRWQMKDRSYLNVLPKIAKTYYDVTRPKPELIPDYVDNDEDSLSEEYNPHNNDHNPDFRIIGGNPATSSGLPISSKGRSGYVDAGWASGFS